MGKKDVRQTFREYTERKGRIKIRDDFEEQRGTKLNEIQDIDREIDRLQKEREKKYREYNEISEKKLEKLAEEYNDSELMRRIISLGRQTTFSRSMVDTIERKCNSGINLDDIDLDLIEEISSLEKAIHEQIGHTNPVGDILENMGKHIKFPGEDG